MKILVVKLSSLGDVLHLFPAISDLRQKFPLAEIHWLVEPAFSEVVGWHEAVNKVIPIALRQNKKKWWKIPNELLKLRRKLHDEKYDVVIDAQGLLKSAILGRLSGIAVFGFSRMNARESLAALLYRKTASIPEGLHVIEKNRQLISTLFDVNTDNEINFGLDHFRKKLAQKTPSTGDFKISSQQYFVILHGTTWDSKYWLESAWIDLIQQITHQGFRCVIPWGNEIEYQRAKRFQRIDEINIEVLPKLSLTELMTVILNARSFISVESGIGHLAAALDIPGVMLHGPTSPNYSGILGKYCQHVISDIACSPCFKRNCPIMNEAGIPPCQQALTVQRIFSMLKI